MIHFGIISPPVPGHINPFSALGRELIERGHRVTVFHFADLEKKIHAEGLEFYAIGQKDHPFGAFPESLARLGRLHGVGALRFTINAVAKTTEMFLRDGSEALKAANIDMLLADQMEPVGSALAEHLGIPFVTICNALVLNQEWSVPPPFTPWTYNLSVWGRVRNALGYRVSSFLTGSVTKAVQERRKQWKLPLLRSADESFSKLAQISQQVAAFDFPRKELPPCFHYVGPLRKNPPRPVEFPWDKLDGRPLIYASLGSLQNRREAVFKCFAEACQDLKVQLLITHGGGLGEDFARTLPGTPLVVSYAPQTDVLKRARLTLTHAGLNTVLDSLAAGVPLVAIPITYEQPAIANRIQWVGAGKVLALGSLNAMNVRKTIQEVMGDASCQDRARRIQEKIAEAGGVKRAADIIEQVLRTGVAVTTS
jgi:zeaxanthin glucosyltransferase